MKAVSVPSTPSALNFLLLSALLFNGQVSASKGDELPEFVLCVKQCDLLTCPGSTLKYPEITHSQLSQWKTQQKKYHAFQEMPLPPHLEFLGWGCLDNCDYQCQRLVTEARMKRGEEIYQFHGKWPFIRVLGIQELFSTLFSVGNFIPHYYGFKLILSRYWKETRQLNGEFAALYFAYLIVSIVAMCAWFFSTCFHLRDTWDRERLDYFFAGATVLSGFYAIVVRVFNLYLEKNAAKRFLFGLIVILMYAGHITRLLVDWSYTYNMRANIFCGLVQNVLWCYHSFRGFQETKRSNNIWKDLTNPDVNWTLIPLFLVGSVTAGMSFELFDFAPLWELIDAHALWHLATIWPAFYWYSYMARDVEDGLRDKKLY